MFDYSKEPTQHQEGWCGELTNICNDNDAPLIKNIKEQSVVAAVKKFIISSWTSKVKDPDNFPGPQPVSLERNDIIKLTKYAYAVCEKTDGMRYMLAALKINDNGVLKNSTFLVDRSFKIYTLNGAWSCCSVYDGTLLDGEVVRNNKGEYLYYPHDCIMRAGINYGLDNFRKRYEHSKEVSVLWRKTENSIVGVQYKMMYDLKDLKKLVSKETEHPVDGLIFTPIGLGVQSGTQHSLIKWKKPDKHTFDFEVEMKGQRADLFVFDKMSLTKFKTLNKRTPLGKSFINEMNLLITNEKMEEINIEENKAFPTKLIVECSLKDSEYFPLKIRRDKLRPNSLRTIEKTLLNIEENITESELLNLTEKLETPKTNQKF
tara:strand:- start:1163 stop:2284 length:1122 start_codon:yes stop_codon:yes gene_type:complete